MAGKPFDTPKFDDDLNFAGAFLRSTMGSWREEAQRTLHGRELASLTSSTHEGLEIKPLYTEEDLPPYRARIPSRQRGTWETCCSIDLREPEGALNEAMSAVIQGASAFWISVDRRSSSWAKLTIGVLAELLEATAGAPIYLDGRGITPSLAAVFMAAARRRGASFETLRGGFDYDPLGTLAGDGNLPWSLESSLELMTDMVRWCAKMAPSMRALSISTLPYAKGGATAVQELGFALSTGAEYLRRLERDGIPPEDSFRHMRFVLPVGRDLFMEIAKLRAARLLWAEMAAACEVDEPNRYLPIHAVTSPRSLTIRDPWVNLIRGTEQCYAAVVGDADVITVLPYNSALGHPDDLGRRTAINVHNILREECHLDQVTDPAAGSYYVERLTYDLAANAWQYFQRIEAAGGMVNHLRSGAVVRDLAESLMFKQRAVATHRDPITGVSSYPNLEESPPERSGTLDGRRQPDDEATGVRPAFGSPSLTFSEAVDAGAEGMTVRELVSLFPGYAEPERLATPAKQRDAEVFERLRDASDRHLEKTGARPRVFLGAVGTADDHRSDLRFVIDLLASGGIAAASSEDLEGPDDTAAAYEASGSKAAIICGAGEIVPDVAKSLKTHGAMRVLVTGRPDDRATTWRASGVDNYVHPGCDALALLIDLFEVEGVRHD